MQGSTIENLEKTGNKLCKKYKLYLNAASRIESLRVEMRYEEWRELDLPSLIGEERREGA